MTSHRNLARAYDDGFLDDLVMPYLGQERDQNLRPDSSLEKLAKLRPVFGGPRGHDDRGQLDARCPTAPRRCCWPARSGRRSTVIAVQAYFVTAQTAAVDHVHKREGLLMAPAYAVARLLARTGLSLQDFDFYEIHEAFAAQVLSTLKAWEDPVFCRERLGRDAAAGRDRPRQAQRPRRLARRRAPVRGHRRADRGQPGQGAARARARAAA